MSSRDLRRVRRIFQRLRGVHGISEEELWRHALFLSKTPDERCRIGLQAARLALSSRRSKKKKSRCIPIEMMAAEKDLATLRVFGKDRAPAKQAQVAPQTQMIVDKLWIASQQHLITFD